MNERPITPDLQSEEKRLDTSLRPTDWTGYVGQTSRDKLNSLLAAPGEEEEEEEEEEKEVVPGLLNLRIRRTRGKVVMITHLLKKLALLLVQLLGSPDVNVNQEVSLAVTVKTLNSFSS